MAQYQVLKSVPLHRSNIKNAVDERTRLTAAAGDYSKLNTTDDQELPFNHDVDDDEGEVIVHVAEPSRARWNHIEDLDSFFKRVYNYHQRHGFTCITLQTVLELAQFLFVVFLTIYLCYGINYQVLFHNVPPPSVKPLPPLNTSSLNYKVTLTDVLFTPRQCMSNMHLWSWFLFIIVILVWLLKLFQCIQDIFYYLDIKQFFNIALGVADNELDNLTWHHVQSRVMAVQREQQMCIHKRELTELDIYHRILRQENYFVAMVNKKLIPPRLKIPFVGEHVCWTTGLRYNLKFLFFWSPCAIFQNPWHLNELYKKANLRRDLATKFGRQVLWLVLLNLIFAPLIFLWQLLYAFFNYTAIIRKEPSILTKRRWSLYGKLYLRHFNELDHELNARLTRAYRPATKYLAAFNSPIGTIVSESVGFCATSVLAVLVVLSLCDEDVLSVEHVLTIMTVLTVIVAALHSDTTADDPISWEPERLLSAVVAHSHYLPEGWMGNAHTAHIRNQFEQLFPYGFVGLLESIVSPLVTPYVLWRYIYPQSLDIVDFFRHFTVSVVGVGDVCSFAQLDIKKHGNEKWWGHGQAASNTQILSTDALADAPLGVQAFAATSATVGGVAAVTRAIPADATESPPSQERSHYEKGEDGKVELSLVHFAHTNPRWKPAQKETQNFVSTLSSVVPPISHDQQLASNDTVDRGFPYEQLDPGQRLWQSRNLMDVSDMETDAIRPDGHMSSIGRSISSDLTSSQVRSGMWRVEGPSINSAHEMAASVTYLHNVFSTNAGRNQGQFIRRQQQPGHIQETTPLLHSEK